MASVVAPLYRRGKNPAWHFVPPGSPRASCGVLPSARLQGTKQLVTVTCDPCKGPMWDWAIEKYLTADNVGFTATVRHLEGKAV